MHLHAKLDYHAVTCSTFAGSHMHLHAELDTHAITCSYMHYICMQSHLHDLHPWRMLWLCCRIGCIASQPVVERSSISCLQALPELLFQSLNELAPTTCVTYICIRMSIVGGYTGPQNMSNRATQLLTFCTSLPSALTHAYARIHVHKQTSQCLAVLLDTELTDALMQCSAVTSTISCMKMMLCRSSRCSWYMHTPPESGRISRQTTSQTRVPLPWSMVSRALKGTPSSSWMGPGSCCGPVCFFGRSLRLL